MTLFLSILPPPVPVVQSTHPPYIPKVPRYRGRPFPPQPPLAPRLRSHRPAARTSDQSWASGPWPVRPSASLHQSTRPPLSRDLHDEVPARACPCTRAAVRPDLKMGAAARPNPLNPQVIPLLPSPPTSLLNLCQIFLCKTFLFFPLSLYPSPRVSGGSLLPDQRYLIYFLERHQHNLLESLPRTHTPAPSFSIPIFYSLLQHSTAQLGTPKPKDTSRLHPIPSLCVAAHPRGTSSPHIRHRPSQSLSITGRPSSSYLAWARFDELRQPGACLTDRLTECSDPSIFTPTSPGYAIVVVPINNLIILPTPSAAAVNALVDRQPFNCLSISSPHPTDEGPASHCIPSHLTAGRFGYWQHGSPARFEDIPDPLFPQPLSFPFRAITRALTVRPAHAHPLNSLDAIGGRLSVYLLCAIYLLFTPPGWTRSSHQSILTSILTVKHTLLCPVSIDSLNPQQRLVATRTCTRRSSRRLFPLLVSCVSIGDDPNTLWCRLDLCGSSHLSPSNHALLCWILAASTALSAFQRPV